jgi:hypothetical protein
MDLVGWLFGGSQVVEGAPAALSALQSLRHSGQSERIDPLATQAYTDFAASGSDFLFNLHVIANISPQFSGALWTWPQLWRAHRDLMSAMSRLVVATTRMVMAGSDAVNDAAFTFGETLSPLTEGLEVNRRRLTKCADFEERQDTANRALRAFLLVVRDELGKPAPAETD